jgi:hypothetical protein
MNQLDGLISGTAMALSAAEGRATEVVLAIDQQAPARARVQPLDDDNTKQIDPFLKYQNGFFCYCKRKNDGNLQKYRCTPYYSPRSSFPEVWADYKSMKAFPTAIGGGSNCYTRSRGTYSSVLLRSDVCSTPRRCWGMSLVYGCTRMRVEGPKVAPWKAR